MTALIWALGLTAIAPLVAVFGYVFLKGYSVMNLDFFTNLPAPPGAEGGGMANAVLGSLILAVIASIVGIPVGVALGIYLSEFSKTKLASNLRFVIDLMTSIPSIVVGLFVYSIVVLPMKSFSAWAGGLALALIMLPVIAKTTEEVLRLVPVYIREAGLALGLSRWRVILSIVVKGSFSGILTGILLSLARIMGETAPLIFTAFANQYWLTSLNQPTPSLPVQIYTYAVSPYPEWHAQAWAGAFLLVGLIFAMNLGARFLMRTQSRGKHS